MKSLTGKFWMVVAMAAANAASAEGAISDDFSSAEGWATITRAEALFHAAEGNYDIIIVSFLIESHDALRLCSQMRALDRTRNVPILAICDSDDNARMIRGLEIGINDYLLRPVDKNELHARVRTQIRKKRYAERLRDNVQMSIEMAINDSLTGLYNRRYMESHLATLVEQATTRGKALTALVLDIDYFKAVNDTHGHDAGDDVLREFAARIGNKKFARTPDTAGPLIDHRRRDDVRPSHHPSLIRGAECLL